VAVALGCLLVLSCGTTENATLPGVVATFTPDAPSPADGSVTLQPGDVTNTIFQVRVSARGIADLFGAAFWVSYDPTYMALRTYDDSASLLRDGGTDVAVQVNATAEAGKVKVGIGRIQNANGTIKGVDVTDPRDLIVLTFVARAAVTASPIVFVDGHGEIVSSATPPNNGIAVTWAGGTLTTR
jgi:hypothetical protein